MKFATEHLLRIQGAVSRGAAILAAASAILIILMLILNHFPFFDESLRVRFLWLTASGLKPNIDFFCPHPALGFMLFEPFMRMLPTTAYSVLALRSSSFLILCVMGYIYLNSSRRISGNWPCGLATFLLIVTAPTMGAYFSEYSIDHLSSLTALGALSLFFSVPNFRNIVIASVLCVLSVLIMPKFALPLALGLLGFLIDTHRAGTTPSRTAAAFVLGIILALGSIAVLYNRFDLSLLDNFRQTIILQYNISKVNGMLNGNVPLLFQHVITFFLTNKILFLSLVLGVACWLINPTGSGQALVTANPISKCGIITGAILSTFFIHNHGEQYIAPVLFSLALFVPYATTLAKPSVMTSLVSLFLPLAALLTIFLRLEAVAQDFRATLVNYRGDNAVTRNIARNNSFPMEKGPPGIAALDNYERILRIVPEHERVIAVWPYHPLFRRDLTFITFDEIFSHANGLPPNDPLRNFFEPEYFRAELYKSPPALIVIDKLMGCYPPWWHTVAQEFLRHNGTKYGVRTYQDTNYYIRSDLLRDER